MVEEGLDYANELLILFKYKFVSQLSNKCTMLPPAPDNDSAYILANTFSPSGFRFNGLDRVTHRTCLINSLPILPKTDGCRQ